MCGIFGIISNKNIHINQLISILEQLEHRGKDSYGITFITDTNQKKTIKSLEKIKNYNNEIYNNLKIGITHNRYSTTKNKSQQAFMDEIQPLQFKNNSIEFDLVHNGNISNISNIPTYISYDENLSDTQNIITFFNDTTIETFENTLINFINSIHCSYSIIILFQNSLYVLRDSYGYKPLFLGTIHNQYCVVSEDCINDFIKIREVQSGEIIKITENTYETIYKTQNPIQLKCIFEYIYFMNENTSYNNTSVYNIRKNLGQNLALLEKIKFNSQNTIVVGSPNTAIPMGIGFAEYLDLEYVQVLKKRSDCGRTFLLKDQNSRQKYCKKFIFDTEKIKNKSIILVDDSLVRGNTVQSLSQMFYENGCKELHIRICSPELKFPCYYGIDIPTTEELIINNYNIPEIETKFNLSSLRYITIEKMLETFGEDTGFCCACFNGEYNKELDW
jgi:amidophosphoribosyltransferase